MSKVAKEIIWKKENPISAIPKSIEDTYTMTQTMLRGIYHMIIGDISTKEIGGPIAILQLTGKQAKHGMWSLLIFVAFISINLGILNLLPIPVLDGGHILFNFIEIITRRKVSEKTIDIAQKIGLTLLIMLMAFAFYNDIMRLVQTRLSWKRYRVTQVFLLQIVSIIRQVHHAYRRHRQLP